MSKEIYERAEMIVTVFKKEDIVTASDVTEDPLGPDFTQNSNDLEVLPFG